MQHLSPLSKPQATVLALWSFGMVLARSCALTAVSHLLAKGMKRKEQTMRQLLREWYYEAPRKRGPQRQALRIETCFAPLLGWVVSWWQGTQLALDAMTLGQRLVVLAISVVYRGCAIPIAWVIVPAGAKHAWRREGCACCASCAPPSRRARQCLSWPIAGWMRRGYFGASHGWAGIRFCASIRVAAFGPRGRPAGALCRPSRRSQARSGRGTGSPLRATRAPARCWRAGKRGTKPPGCS
jgi:hypothetical protein